MLANDVKVRQRDAARGLRLNRFLALLSAINSLIVRVSGRGELFENVCRIAVSVGEFQGAWIGQFDAAASSWRLLTAAGVDDPLWAVIHRGCQHSRQ